MSVQIKVREKSKSKGLSRRPGLNHCREPGISGLGRPVDLPSMIILTHSLWHHGIQLWQAEIPGSSGHSQLYGSAFCWGLFSRGEGKGALLAGGVWLGAGDEVLDLSQTQCRKLLDEMPQVPTTGITEPECQYEKGDCIIRSQQLDRRILNVQRESYRRYQEVATPDHMTAHISSQTRRRQSR